MDLTLALTYQQQNDNKAVVLTDTTTNWNSSTTNLTNGDALVSGDFYEIVADNGSGTFTGNGSTSAVAGSRFVATGTPTLTGTDEVSPVTPTYGEITAMTLDTIITGVDETATSKDQVDLLSEFGPFAAAADTVYTITAALLGDAADSLLIDGLYALTYTVTYSGAEGAATKTDVLLVTILVYGQVKVATYEKLRGISVAYMCSDGCPSSEINEADLCGAYLSGIENSAFTAKTEELLAMLVVLDNIITNGSKITW